MSHEIRTPLNGVLGMARGSGKHEAERAAARIRLHHHRERQDADGAARTTCSISPRSKPASSPSCRPTPTLPTCCAAAAGYGGRRRKRKGLEFALVARQRPPCLALVRRHTRAAVRVEPHLQRHQVHRRRPRRGLAALEGAGGRLAPRRDPRVIDTGPGMDAETQRPPLPGLRPGRRDDLSASMAAPVLACRSAPPRRDDGRRCYRHQRAWPRLDLPHHLPRRPGQDATPPNRARAQASARRPAAEQLKQSNLRILLVDDHPINRQVGPSPFPAPLQHAHRRGRERARGPHRAGARGVRHRSARHAHAGDGRADHDRPHPQQREAVGFRSWSSPSPPTP